MKMRTLLNRVLLAAGGLLAVATSSYAHWGPGSALVTYGQGSAYCDHAHAGNTFVRRARVRVIRAEEFQECTPIGDVPGCVPLPPLYWHDAEARNMGSTADIILAGTDDFTSRNFPLPYFGLFNNVPRDATRSLSVAYNNRHFYNLRAQCFVSHDMLN